MNEAEPKDELKKLKENPVFASPGSFRRVPQK
jgi:hypothetical protein